MVAFANTCEPEATSEPLFFGSAVAVAVEDDGAVADRILSASAVCSGEQGGATFTGYITDNEAGLLHARARQYSPTLGRFVGRDQLTRIAIFGVGYPQSFMGYWSGFLLYGSYFVPNRLDPFGFIDVEIPLDDGTSVTIDVTFDDSFGTDEAMKKKLIEDLTKARQTIDRAEKQQKKDPKSGISRWYGAEFEELYEQFAFIDKLRRFSKITFYYDPCCVDRAYVKMATGQIYFCPEYFKGGDGVRTVIHEFTHKFMRTEDFGYGGPENYTPGGDGPLKDPKQKVNNADTIAGWVMEMGRKK